MKSTTEKTRRKAPTLAPMIREVCLIGSPGRSYVHLALIDWRAPQGTQDCRDPPSRSDGRARPALDSAEFPCGGPR